MLRECPNCKSPIRENDYGFFCSANKQNDSSSCQFKLWKQSFGAKFNEKDLKRLLKEGKTYPKKALSRKGKPYKFYLSLEDDKQHLKLNYLNKKNNIKQLDLLCPICHSKINKINGKYGVFFACPKRHLSFSQKQGDNILDELSLKILLRGQYLGPLEFTSKDGELYSAYLKLNFETGNLDKV